MPRSVVIDLDGVLDSLASGEGGDGDEVTERILDAATELFVRHGIGRCTIEEVADRSGLGRTTVYRRVQGRRQLVNAVLARECQRFFAALLAATPADAPLRDQVARGVVAGLAAVEGSALADLVRTEPEVLRLFTVDGEPLVRAATAFLVGAFGPVEDATVAERVEQVAEVLVRLSVSLVLTPSTSLPVRGDGAEDDLAGVLAPLVGPLGRRRTP